MQIYDTHVHTTFSADGVSKMEDYASLVREGIIKGAGFAEHIDFLPWCGSYGHLDPAQYIKAVYDFREKGYEFFAGAEIDYAKQAEADILNNINKYKYSYTICSVHLVDHMSISDKVHIPAITERERLRIMIFSYYDELKWSLRIPEFDVIGHFGVYRRYLGDEFYNDTKLMKEIKELDSEIARLCAESGKILEINTSGLYSPLSATIPDANFIRDYYQYGGRNVSVGSDAHNASHIARGFGTAFEMLKELGFRYIMKPWDKGNPWVLY